MTSQEKKQARRTLLELCAASLDDVQAGLTASVDRIELNCGFPLGGLTPTQPLLEGCLDLFAGPVIAMIRPREGGFHYSAAERRQMYREAELLLGHGAQGVAIGFLTIDYQVDEAECRRFRDTFPEATLVFHRAFDLCSNLPDASRLLSDCGFDRILTSGGAATAMDGVQTLRHLIQTAGDDLEILPAGGIRAGNVKHIVTATGANQVHTAARGTVSLQPPNRSDSLIETISDWFSHGHTSTEALSALRAELDGLESYRVGPHQ